MVQWSMVFFCDVSMYLVQAAWNRIRPMNQQEQTSNEHESKHVFSFSKYFCNHLPPSQCHTRFYHLWSSKAHIMMLPAFFKWAEDLPLSLVCAVLRVCSNVDLKWAVSVADILFYAKELEHLNVTWVSERDVPETVEMWNCKTWILCICRGLFYFVQHYQFKVICECISTLKLHPGWSWMHKALAV